MSVSVQTPAQLPPTLRLCARACRQLSQTTLATS